MDADHGDRAPLRGHCSIQVGSTGIIDFRAATEKMAVNWPWPLNPESRVRLGEEVLDITQAGGISNCRTTKPATARYACCGGLQSDRLARRTGCASRTGSSSASEGITTSWRTTLLLGAPPIYPVPDPRFLSWACTPHAHDRRQHRVRAQRRVHFQARRLRQDRLRPEVDTVDALTYGGTWKLFRRTCPTASTSTGGPSARSCSAHLRRLVPRWRWTTCVRPGRCTRHVVGHGWCHGGRLPSNAGARIHALNALSPAATAALAIGREIVSMAVEQLHIGEALPQAERNLSARHPNWSWYSFQSTASSPSAVQALQDDGSELRDRGSRDS